VRRHEVGNQDRSAALRLPRRGSSAVCPPVRVSRLRLSESHKSGGRPAPPDGSAEYDFRFRAEEKLAVYLAAVARLVQTISALEVRAYFRFDGSRVCSSYGAEQVPASRPCLQHARSEQTAATVTVSVPEKSGRLAAERSPTSAPRPERARVDAASRRSREAEARRRPSGDSGMVFRMEAEAASEAPGEALMPASLARRAALGWRAEWRAGTRTPTRPVL
jgi:hypothetical protein